MTELALDSVVKSSRSTHGARRGIQSNSTAAIITKIMQTTD
jgi:hypothetical protein